MLLGGLITQAQSVVTLVGLHDSLTYQDEEVVSVPLLRLNRNVASFTTDTVPYLSDLRAIPDGPTGIQLKWRKTDERRAAYYAIERSVDGRVFRSVGRIRARGGDEAVVDYSFRDRKVTRRKFFYRLKQVNRDGSRSYSHEVIFQRMKRRHQIALIPSAESAREYTVKLGKLFKGEKVYIELLNPRGKRLRKRIVKRANFKLTTKGLVAGVYTLRVLDEEQWIQRRVVVY
ncbi:hypothetical protein LEM8419_01556 [Neolewinella maritima]|uniref:T9SS type A sorting domain-containing protein n=1 Tax=Neolewinella maritima TaxID=1383882 RepID=A0ABM9B036_9BACT|nr:hypothetical protein [Neolewinella maritima]CAH1000403.1 hypothetical protein LEM8419_01556 [Neolewinella maritima]